jgi:hypothetical protein
MAPGILLSEDTVMVEVPSQAPQSDSSSPAVIEAEEQPKNNIEDMFDDDGEDDELLSSLMPVQEG